MLDTCRRLKERKSYMVYTAVGCLGVSALNDLIKEVIYVSRNLVLHSQEKHNRSIIISSKMVSLSK